MITIDDIKRGYLDGALAKLTDYDFNIVSNEGELLSPMRSGNTVKQFINGILTMRGADIRALGTDSTGSVSSYIFAFDCNLRFLLPIDDRVFMESSQGNYSYLYKNVQDFRTALSSTLSGMRSVKITIDGEEYTGGVFVDLPTVAELSMEIRQDIGNSIEYNCSFSIALVKGGMNTQDTVFMINGAVVPFMSYNIDRTPTLSADLISTRANGSSSAYAESAAFKIDFSAPALKNTAYNTAVLNYIMGKANANTPVDVHFFIDGIPLGYNDEPVKMIFASAKVQGEGVSNLIYNVTLVNYTPDGEIIQ